MQMPTMTQDDFIKFHQLHFPNMPVPPLFVFSEEEPPSVASEEPEAEEEDLGYYPDGVRRTLTDEVIAQMRQQEIKELLRKRHREAEDSASDSNVHTSAPPASVSRQDNQGKNKKRRKNRHKRNKNAGTQSQPRQKPDADSNEGITYRRLARELDEQETTQHDLDY